MKAVTYYKFGNLWFVDCPEYLEKGGKAENLEKIGSFHDFLEFVAQGETTLVFHMSDAPFDDSDILERTGCSGDGSGGYYQISSFKNVPVDFEIWFNDVLLSSFGRFPERLYINKADATGKTTCLRKAGGCNH